MAELGMPRARGAARPTPHAVGCRQPFTRSCTKAIGVVYNLIAVGLVIMVFVIFIPHGLARLALPSRRRILRRNARIDNPRA